MTFRVAIDGGGTFTDGVVVDESGVATVAKAHSTPHDPSIGTVECLRKLAALTGRSLQAFLTETATIVHGTTLALNVVATRSGPKLGVITTTGFRDRMLFPQVAKGEWRECTADPFEFRIDGPTPLTRRHLMTEVTERLNFRGEVLTPLYEDSVLRAIAYLRGKGAETVAVNLLFSHLNPAHELRIGEILAREWPAAHVALSHKVLPVQGEVDRWSTTMFSAYVSPAVKSYATRLEGLLRREGLAGELVFIQNNGGLATLDIVAENPAVLLISGPAAGPSMGLFLGKQYDKDNVLSVDMGGTSFDIGVAYEGSVGIVQQQIIDAKKFCLPSVDVSAVGAGGGSIAWIDSGGRLQVGPQSAGANPGPACYGKGGLEPTVTDANIVLGYLDPAFFLGGESRLNRELSEKAIKEKIADPLGLSVIEAAAAIYQIINSNMAGATDVTFVKRGYDPRDFTLVAAGGAAAVHAVEIMRDLGMKSLIIPKVAPAFCAYGMLCCDLKHDYTQPYNCETGRADPEHLNRLFDAMEKRAVETLRREGVKPGEMVIEKSLSMRYYGQIREKTAAMPSGRVTKGSLEATTANFHRVHEATIGYADTAYPTEIVRLHLSGSARVASPRLKPIPKGDGNPTHATKSTREAYFSGRGLVAVSVYDGGKLRAGDVLRGPCISEEPLTTVVVPPDSVLRIDDLGNYATIQ